MKRIIAMILILLCMVFSLSACDDEVSHTEYLTELSRDYWLDVIVLYDNETKVMYLKGLDSGFVMMVNPDGTPRLYHGE